jgi:hypothetical protein
VWQIVGFCSISTLQFWAYLERVRVVQIFLMIAWHQALAAIQGHRPGRMPPQPLRQRGQELAYVVYRIL